MPTPQMGAELLRSLRRAVRLLDTRLPIHHQQRVARRWAGLGWTAAARSSDPVRLALSTSAVCMRGWVWLSPVRRRIVMCVHTDAVTASQRAGVYVRSRDGIHVLCTPTCTCNTPSTGAYLCAAERRVRYACVPLAGRRSLLLLLPPLPTPQRQVSVSQSASQPPSP